MMPSGAGGGHEPKALEHDVLPKSGHHFSEEHEEHHAQFLGSDHVQAFWLIQPKRIVI
jgi:hypothetical protein